MANVLLGPAELESLTGLPHAAIVLYLVLRRHMDYATGIVGLARGVSWLGLTEELYVESRQGMTARSFSREQVRRMSGHLERSGLAERHSVEKERLIFFLPKAQTDKCAPKKADTRPTQVRQGEPDMEHPAATPQQERLFVIRDGEGQHRMRQEQIRKPGTPPVSGLINPLTTFGGDAPPEIGGAPRSDLRLRQPVKPAESSGRLTAKPTRCATAFPRSAMPRAMPR